MEYKQRKGGDVRLRGRIVTVVTMTVHFMHFLGSSKCAIGTLVPIAHLWTCQMGVKHIEKELKVLTGLSDMITHEL